MEKDPIKTRDYVYKKYQSLSANWAFLFYDSGSIISI